MKTYYIRFGRLPVNGRSKVYRNGEIVIGEEEGVSAYEAEKNKEGKWRIRHSYFLDGDDFSEYCINSLQGLLLAVSVSGKHVFLVKGDVVGYGTDKEPLLQNVEVLEDITEDFKIDYTEPMKATIYY